MMALVNVKSLALLAWALVNGSLLLSIGGELGWGDNLEQSIPVPEVLPPVPIEITLPPDFRLPAQEKGYAQTLERPLFVPSRRKSPPVPAAPPPPPPTMQKGQFQLMGTIITDEMRVAVIKEISSGKERQVVQGYNINGLQLDLVEADRIVFSQYGDQEEIGLKLQRSPKSVAAPQSVLPGKLQAVPAQPGQPAGWTGGQRVAPVQVENRPADPPPPPQTMEERARDPMLKDFYKK